MYVGVSSEDSLLSTLPGSCVTLWVVSSAFRNAAFSSDTLVCLLQSAGSVCFLFFQNHSVACLVIICPFPLETSSHVVTHRPVY